VDSEEEREVNGDEEHDERSYTNHEAGRRHVKGVIEADDQRVKGCLNHQWAAKERTYSPFGPFDRMCIGTRPAGQRPQRAEGSRKSALTLPENLLFERVAKGSASSVSRFTFHVSCRIEGISSGGFSARRWMRE
jgi:hypothetical protein